MIKQWIFLPLFLLSLLMLPKKGAEQMRSFAVSAVAPCWNFFQRKTEDSSADGIYLELENQMLRGEIRRLKKFSAAEEYLHQELERLIAYSELSQDPFFARRGRYLSQILSRQLQALPARVVFREPANWSSSLWINVGERDNQAIGKTIIEKDSPVVVGKAIVGIVEEVGQRRSRIRLITDEHLTPSVRVIRGGEQNKILTKQVKELIATLALRNDLKGAEEMVHLLKAYFTTLDIEKRDLYLAKGEIHGASRPLWRMLGQKLKGVGFHYNCSDEEGEAKELRSTEPLIQIGDILVTTGMDGLFPPDLYVGVVTKISPLHEGDTFYSIEANALAPDLDSLTEVYVLPKQF